MSNFDDVKTFMQTFGQEIKIKAKFPEEKIVKLRYNLIKEELNELQNAIKTKDLKYIIAHSGKELSDLVMARLEELQIFGIKKSNS